MVKLKNTCAVLRRSRRARCVRALHREHLAHLSQARNHCLPPIRPTIERKWTRVRAHENLNDRQKYPYAPSESLRFTADENDGAQPRQQCDKLTQILLGRAKITP